MKKILLITGKLAAPLVKEYSDKSRVETETLVIPTPVATFIDPKTAIKEIRKLDLNEYRMILVPGLVLFDPSEIERETGVPVYRGPKHAADLPVVLDNLERIELSKKVPACKLLKSEIEKATSKILQEIEREALRDMREPSSFLIGEGKSAIGIGGKFPPRVMAEIPDAPSLPEEEVIKMARRYLKEGAEILDVGMVGGREEPEKAGRLVSLLKEKFGVPVSIDTMNLKEIKSAVDSGADLILSLSWEGVEKFEGLDVPVVLVPRRKRSPRERCKDLLELVKKARKLGFKRVIADPIIEPLNMGFVASLTTFSAVREREPDLPLLMGVGNVVELCDADSIGMTALLAGAACELKVSILLTVEASDKTRGNVFELRRARDIITLAKWRKSVPKDLGIDMLILKEKRRIFERYDKKIEGSTKVVRARPPPERKRFKMESGRFFRIYVSEGEIVVILYEGRKPEIVFKGEKSETLCHEILGRGLVKDPVHAAYLGRELQKAEIALKTGRGYIQEEEIF